MIIFYYVVHRNLFVRILLPFSPKIKIKIKLILTSLACCTKIVRLKKRKIHATDESGRKRVKVTLLQRHRRI